MILVHYTFSLQVYKQVRLSHNISYTSRKIIYTFNRCCLFNSHRKLVSSRLPCHSQTVAHNTRNCKVEHILSMFISCLILDQFRITSGSTCTDNCCFTCDFDFISIFICCKNYCHFSIFHYDFLCRCLQQYFHAKFLGSGIQSFVHE